MTIAPQTADAKHEAAIQRAYDEWLEHGRDKPGLWTRLVDLINQREDEKEIQN